jgi:hypothetical protein
MQPVVFQSFGVMQPVVFQSFGVMETLLSDHAPTSR